MKLGFYDYDQAVLGSDGVIFKEDLTSLGSMTAIGSPSFDASGMTTTQADGAKITLSAAEQTKLQVEGTMLLWSTPETLSAEVEDIPPVEANWLVFKGVIQWNINRHGTASPIRGNSGRIRVTDPSVLIGHRTIGDFWCYTTAKAWNMKNGKVEVIFTWDAGGMDIYVDRGLVYSSKFTDSDTPLHTEIDIGSSGFSGLAATFADGMLATKKMVLPSSDLRVINCYGDSYTQLGYYHPHESNNRQAHGYDGITALGVDTLTRDGQNGTGYDSSSANMDGGITPTVQREMNRRGIFLKDFWMWAEGGSGLEATGAGLGQTLGQRVTTSLTYETPDVALFTFGYNDASQNSGAGPTDMAAYQVLLESVFDDLVAANSNIKITLTTLPYNTNASYAPTLASTQAINTVLATVAAAYSQVSLVDVYSLFGGAANDGTGNMSGDFVHPDTDGNVIIGRAVAAAL